MKCKPIPVLIMILLLFAQCKKEKDEKPVEDLSKGCLAYFELNDGFEDSADNFDVTYGGFLGPVKNRHGYSGRALSFNGGSFSFTTPFWRAIPITVSLWVKPHDLDHNNYMVQSYEAAFGIYQQKSKIGFAICNPDTAMALADLKVEWTHVAGTFDGQDIKTYINGKLVTTLRHPGVPDVTTSIVVGAFQIPEWKGTLDDIRFYNRVLTAEEIRHLALL
jgi:hypothetical protein